MTPVFLTKETKINPLQFSNLARLGSYQIKAFTLAETLITLAIIGIIAALTIPNLVRHYKAAQLRSAFLNAASTVTNVGGKLGAEGFELEQYETIYSARISPQGNMELARQIAANFKNSTNFKFLSDGFNESPYKRYNGGSAKADATILIATFDLPNSMTGLIFQIATASPYKKDDNLSYCTRVYVLAIDINGMKKQPNRYGHDVFFWVFTPTSKTFVPMGSKEAQTILKGPWYNRNCNDSTYAEGGTNCAKDALTDPNYFKNLLNEF